MAELEKVATLLDDMRLFANLNVHSIVSPDNWNVYAELCDMIDKAKDDVISLLKAQEPVLLENQHKPGGHFINANSPWISRCPKCGKKIEGKQTRFCKYCGQAVKWNGFDRKTLV